MPVDLFRIDDLPTPPLSRAALRVAQPLLHRTLQIDALLAGYQRAKQLTAGSFPARALNVLEITLDIGPQGLAHVPSEGPLVVAANHPHGVLDGLLLASALERVRPDVRLLANSLLQRLPEMQEICFFVDPFGGPDAAARSHAGLRAAHLWLRQGHTLIAFPAGEVAHAPAPQGTTHADSAWHDTIGRLALATRASVVPAHIEGCNSRLFYAAGRIHPLLRTLLLPRELMRQQGRSVRVRFGRPEKPSFASTPRDVIRQIRVAADALALDETPSEARVTASPSMHGLKKIACEVEALPEAACLVESDAFRVYCARASEIPRTLDEIGRLREVTYRSVGEGTGRCRDLDTFDRHYSHLFLWDRASRRLAGAYRIGDVGAIVRDAGVAGLYTRQLFKYDEAFVTKLGPSLELGRSWVRAEYQKNYSALLMLWRGIGRFAAERSDARVLFGTVSISARYSDRSHELLMAFLSQNHLDRSLAELVEALHPRAQRPVREPATVVLPRSIDEANALVSSIEADGKGMPVLLRQYLKLNARLIGFNVDPDFNEALDALMMVDLTTADPSILTRYLGKLTAEAFVARRSPINGRERAA